MDRFTRAWMLLLFAATLLIVPAALFSGHAALGKLLNSDALYLPALFDDVLRNGGHVDDWLLPPAPYFFPDWLLFLPAWLVGDDTWRRVIFFAAWQILLLLPLVWLLMRRAGVRQAPSAAMLAVILLVWLALTAGEPFDNLLCSAFHYGIFLAALLFWPLWHACQHTARTSRRRLLLLALAALAFLCTLSDNLFIVQVTAPFVATIMLLHLRRPAPSASVWWGVLLVALCSIAGSLAYRFVVAWPTRYTPQIGLERAGANAAELYAHFTALLHATPALALLLALWLALLLRQTWRWLRRCGQDDGDERFITALFLFSALSLCASLAVMLLTTNLPPTMRYLTAALSWPVVLVVLCAARARGPWFMRLVPLLALLPVLHMAHSALELRRANGLHTRFHDDVVACIDNALDGENLRYGIAQYWDAKRLQNLSRHPIVLAQMSWDLGDAQWVTSTRFYRDSYDFAVISDDADYKISRAELLARSGEPRKVVQCGGKSVHIYGPGLLRTQKFLHPGDAHTWLACHLPSKIGAGMDNCAMRKKNPDDAGWLIFGPYDRLPAGRYAFELRYSASDPADMQIGALEASLFWPKKKIPVLAQPLYGTQGEGNTLRGEFDIPAEHHNERIELRMNVNRESDPKAISLTLRRIS